MMSDRERYLGELATSLPLPAPVRDEVLEELAAHLADTISDLEAQGIDRSAAEAEAVHRLGPPRRLARDLARARRDDRLLAAAGGGTIAALRTAIPATFVATLLVALATVLLVLAIGAVGRVLGFDLQLSMTDGWNTVLTAVGFDIAALLTGAAAVRGAARSGWRTADEVRPGVIVVGGATVAWLALVAFGAALNWASVAALISVPFSFVLGARVDRLRPPRVTIVTVATGVGLLVVAFLWALPGYGSVGGGYSWDDVTHDYEIVGPWWQDRSTDRDLDFPEMDWQWLSEGLDQVSVTAARPAVLADFHDLRLEAWRAEPPRDGWSLERDQHAPFASVPMSVDGLRATGVIRYDQTPGVEWAQLIVTGMRSDGVRYILAAGGPEQTIFRGSVLSWFEALLR